MVSDQNPRDFIVSGSILAFARKVAFEVTFVHVTHQQQSSNLDGFFHPMLLPAFQLAAGEIGEIIWPALGGS
jgi:hypothetical protein